MLIELAANAVDAARQAGEPGRLLLRLVGPPAARELRLANNGAPLTGSGVAALASLRASAKRDSSSAVGHFGVGFTAVLAVTDRPEVHSKTGSVRFDRLATAEAVELLENPPLSAEMDRRQGLVPALRLVWPVAPAPIPPGFTTEVVLPLTVQALGKLDDLLRIAGPELFWALPDLASLEMRLDGHATQHWLRAEEGEGVTALQLGEQTLRYRSVTARGTIPAELLTGRPIEEQSRNRWQLSWILPIESTELFAPAVSSGPARTNLGAPTPTDEPLSLAARLVGTFPVDDTRRRLATGALTDFLLDKAAEVYVDLIGTVPRADRLKLVPSAGFPLGPVDGALREAIVLAATRRPLLLTAGGDPVTPRSACVIPGISDLATELLEEAVPGLLVSPRGVAETEALRLLGVRFLALSAATQALASIDREPEFWRRVYSALVDNDTEELADLPVPLAGGGRRIGPRTCLIPELGRLSADLLARACLVAPDLPIVHPDASHLLLERLGAGRADAGTLLVEPSLVGVYEDFREALEDVDPDLDELDLLAGVALDLAEAAGVPPGRRTGVLASVVLTDADGQPWPANELLATDAPLAAVLAEDTDLPTVAHRWLVGRPEWVLAAVGVRSGLRVMHFLDPTGPDPDLPQGEDWWAEAIGDRTPPAEYSAVADLDLIDDEAWPQVLAMIERDRAVRDALVLGPQPSYTGWWLGQFAEVAGAPINRWRLPGAIDLAGLYDVFPLSLPDDLAVAVGVLGSIADAARIDPGHLLRRYADPDREVAPGQVPALTQVIAAMLADDPDLDLPDLVRAVSGDVVYARHAMVLDLPWLVQVIPPGRLVPGGPEPDRVAAALDLRLASSSMSYTISDYSTRAADDGLIARATRALGIAVDAPILVAEPLAVAVDGGAAVPVRWWPGPDGMLVDGSVEAIGRAVAYVGGRWRDRELAVAAAAEDAEAIAEYGVAQ